MHSSNWDFLTFQTNFIHNQFKSRSTSEERAQDFIHYTGDTTALQAEFYNALEKTYRAIIETLKGLVTLKNGRAPPDGVNINAMKTLLESATRHLQSDLSDQLVNTIHLGVSNIWSYS